MAGLVPAIHVFGKTNKDMDARDKPGHDGALQRSRNLPEAMRGRWATGQL